MKKKAIVLVLVLVMIMSVFTGCSTQAECDVCLEYTKVSTVDTGLLGELHLCSSCESDMQELLDLFDMLFELE